MTPSGLAAVYPIDVGVVAPESETQHELSIVNGTDEEWVNPKIRASCSCTKTDIYPKRVKPHEKATLVVVYRAGYKTGSIRERIRITLNDQIPIILELSGEKKNWATPQESGLEIGPFTLGESKYDAELEMDYSRCKGGKVTASSDQQWLTVVPPEIDLPRAGERQIVKYALAADIALLKIPGTHSAVLRFQSKNEGEKLISVPVRAIVSPTIEAEPKRVFLSSIHPGDAYRVTVQIKDARSGGLLIPRNATVSESIDRFVTCVLPSTDATESATRIEIAIPTDARAAFLGGTILFDGGDDRFFTLPINFRID